MTTEQTPEPEDSGAIKAIRESNKRLKQAAREAEQRAEEAYQRARRDIEFEQTYEQFGLPESVRDLVANELEGQEVNQYSMQEAIESLGLNSVGQPAPESDPAPAPEPVSGLAENLESVTSLSNQVAAAASGDRSGGDFYDKLAQTETPEDIANLLREQGQ